MAVKALTVANAKPFDTYVAVTPEAATAAADGFTAEIDGDVIILISNTSEDTNYDVTMKYGNGMAGIADDLLEIAFGTEYVYKPSTSKMKNLSGTDKGKIKIIPENVAVKVKVIEV